jgi:hypothetical protein
VTGACRGDLPGEVASDVLVNVKEEATDGSWGKEFQADRGKAPSPKSHSNEIEPRAVNLEV